MILFKNFDLQFFHLIFYFEISFYGDLFVIYQNDSEITYSELCFLKQETLFKESVAELKQRTKDVNFVNLFAAVLQVDEHQIWFDLSLHLSSPFQIYFFS